MDPIEIRLRGMCARALSSAIRLGFPLCLSVASLGAARATNWLETQQAVVADAYYVSTTGSDSNPGTASAPWRTITKAANTVEQGNTVVIHGGVYNESACIYTSGTASAPITFENYPSETPIIDPSVQVTGWTQYNGSGVWQAAFTPGPGLNCSMGSVPASPMTSCPNNNPLSGNADGFVSVDAIPDQAHWLNPQCLSDPSTVPAGGWFSSGNGYLYANLSDGSNPNEHTIYVQHNMFPILLWTAQWIHLKGLSMRFGENGIGGYGGCQHPENNIFIDSIDISLSHEVGLRAECTTGWIIQNSHFHHNQSHDMQLDASYAIVRYNSFGPWLTNVDRNGNYGLNITGGYNDIISNTFQGNLGAGIGLEQWYNGNPTGAGSAVNNTIEDNRIIEPGGVDIYGGDSNLVKNNLIYTAGGYGVYLQLGGCSGSNPAYYARVANNNLIANNTIYGYQFGLQSDPDMGAGGSVPFVNNTVSNNCGGTVVSSSTGSGGGNTFANNILYLNNTNYRIGANNVLTTTTNLDNGANPLFVNAPAGNIQLSSGSPAIQYGINLYDQGVTQDFNCATRPTTGNFDVGAYQYDSVPSCS